MARLSQTDARTSAVFVDELDPGHLQSFPYFIARLATSAQRAIARFQPLYCWN